MSTSGSVSNATISAADDSTQAWQLSQANADKPPEKSSDTNDDPDGTGTTSNDGLPPKGGKIELPEPGSVKMYPSKYQQPVDAGGLAGPGVGAAESKQGRTRNTKKSFDSLIDVPNGIGR